MTEPNASNGVRLGNPSMPGAIVPNLGQLFTVILDPLWPYINYWKSGTGVAQSNGAVAYNRVLSAMFFDPSDLVFSEGASVTYTSPDIIGRPEPLQVWMNTGAREISMKFRFHVQGQPFIASTANDPDQQQQNAQAYINQEVIQPAKFLDALKYPIIDDQNISHGPPPVIVSVGQLIVMRAIVTSSQIDWEYPIDTQTYLPHACSVQVTFTSASAVVGNYGFQGPYRFKLP